MLFLAFLAVGFWWINRPKEPDFSSKSLVRIAFWPFENETGDDALKWVELGLMDMVGENCRTGKRIEIVPTDKILELKKAEKVPSASTCRVLGADIVVRTVIEKDGDLFRARYALCFPEGHSVERVVVDANLIEVANQLGKQVSQRAAPSEPILDLFDRFNSDPYLNITYASGLQLLLTDGAKQALPYFENCLQRDSGFLLAKLQLAKCYRMLARAEEAETLLNELISQAEERQDPLVKAAGLGILSVLRFYEWDVETAKTYLAEGQAILEGQNERMAAALFQGQLGFIDYALSNYESAEKNLKFCLAVSRESGDSIAEANALNTLAMVTDAREDWPNTQRYCLEALTVFEDLGSRPGIALVKGNLGTYSLKYGEWEQAIPYLEEGMKLYESAGDFAGVARMHLSLALVKVNQNQYDKAIDHCDAGIQICRDQNNQLTLNLLRIQKLRFLADMGQSTDDLVSEMDPEIEALGYEEVANMYALSKAYVYCVQGHLKRAEETLNSVQEEARVKYEWQFVKGVTDLLAQRWDDARSAFEKTQALQFGPWKDKITFYLKCVDAGQAGQSFELPKPGFHLYN